MGSQRKKEMKWKETPLRSRLDKGCLIIEVGVNVLAHAFNESDFAKPYAEEVNNWRQRFRVVDVAKFAAEVREQMFNEKEDGSTPLSDFLDKMCRLAVEDGSQGVEGV
jgi:hypothetical protein